VAVKTSAGVIVVLGKHVYFFGIKQSDGVCRRRGLRGRGYRATAFFAASYTDGNDQYWQGDLSYHMPLVKCYLLKLL